MDIHNGTHEDSNPDRVVADLIDTWCGRRAICPLRWVLPAWPHNGLTDGVAELASALRTVLAMAKHDLTEAETKLVLVALAGYDRALNRR